VPDMVAGLRMLEQPGYSTILSYSLGLRKVFFAF